MARLGALLSEATGDPAQVDLRGRCQRQVLLTILTRLERDYAGQIEQVVAAGDWARTGVDVRNLPYEEVKVHIVLSAAERPLARSQRIAEHVFGDLGDEDVWVQFDLLTLPEWQHAQGHEEALGIPLWSR